MKNPSQTTIITRLKLKKTQAASVKHGNNRYSRWTQTAVAAEYGIFIVMSDGTEGQIATVSKMEGRCPEWRITAEIDCYGQGTSIDHQDAVRMWHRIMTYQYNDSVSVSYATHRELRGVREFIVGFNYDEFGIED